MQDEVGLDGGLNTYGYVDGDVLAFTDPLGLVKHTTGRTIDYGKGCWIRIDYTFNETTGEKRRHLHWGCKSNEVECGENGEQSHGGTWDDAPERIKQCARQNGFNGQSSIERRFKPDAFPPMIPLIPKIGRQPFQRQLLM